MDKMIIEPVDNDYYDNEEPSMVQIRAVNQGIVYLDSQINDLQTNKVDMIVSSRSSRTPDRSILFQDVSRLKFYKAQMNYITPNVNPRNNVVTFFSSVSGLFHTVTVNEGFYNTPTFMMNILISALNTVSGLSGLTFSYILLSSNVADLQSVGGNYYFALNSPMVMYGEQLINLPRSQTPQNSKIVGSIALIYTRYIDICSSTLTQYSKVRTHSNGFNSNIVFRVFVESPGVTNVIRVEPQKDVLVNNMLKGKNITQIDIQLKDQFGQFLYVPQYDPATASGFFWDLEFTAEL
jgi:hypothetical protein